MKNALLEVLKSRSIWYAVLACLLFCLGIHFYTQWDLARFEAELPASKRRPTSEAPAGHFHADGTWHGEPHSPVAALSPPHQAQAHPQETPEFLRWISGTQYVTLAEQVAAMGDVPDRPTLEALSDDQLTELMNDAYEKTKALSLKVEKRMRDWTKVIEDLTRHAKTPAELERLLALNADTVKPLANALDNRLYEYLVHAKTAHRASKVSKARVLIEVSQVTPDSGRRVPSERLTEAFWENYWSDF